MGEIKTNTFQFNISILRAFGGHRPHYQVHINTNLKLLEELINNLLNLQTTYPITTNKSYNGHRKTKIETIPGSKYSY